MPEVKMESIDVSSSINVNNFHKYTISSKAQPHSVLCAKPMKHSQSLFHHLGSPDMIWIYQGIIYPDFGPERPLAVVIGRNL